MSKLVFIAAVLTAVFLGLAACQSSHGMRAAGQVPFALPTPTPTPTMGSKCGTMVTVKWTAPTTNTDGSALTNLAGFKLYYGLSSGNYSQVFDFADPAASTHNFVGLTPGIYYFAATAYAGAPGAYAESAYSKEIPFELLACTHVFFNATTGKIEYQQLDAIEENSSAAP